MKTINTKGFSLIEILVAMGLIGVLTAMAIPAYNNYRGNANKTVLKADVGNAYKAYHAYNAVDGNFCTDLDGAGLNSIKESATYNTKGFVGFDNTTPLISSQCTSVTSANLYKVNGTINMNRGSCKLGSATFKFAVINEFDGNEVGYSVANNNSSPKQGGDYCSKTSSNTDAATPAVCHGSSAACILASNNCGGTGMAGHWRTGGRLCQ